MKTNKNINEEFAVALVTFFPAEAAYFCSLYGDSNMHIYPMDKLEWAVKEYCNDTIAGGNSMMKFFNLGLASKDCRKFISKEPECNCFFIRNGRIIFSDYKHIFADSFEEFGTDFITAEVYEWFIELIYYRANDDVFDFFDDFKEKVAEMPGSKDILSKMSVDDVIDMAKIARRMLGRE